jgi:hypothetical protein
MKGTSIMRKLLVVASLAVTLLAHGVAPLRAQCGQKVTLDSNSHVSAPSGFDQVSLVDTGSGQAQALKVANGAFSADAVSFPLMQAFANASADQSKLVLRWTKSSDASAKCDQPVEFVATQGGIPSQVQDADIYKGCADEVMKKADRIKNLIGDEAYANGRYTVLVLHPELGLCYASRQFGVQGEPIVTGIYTNSTYQLPNLKLDPCSPRPSGPRVFAPTAAIKAPGAQASGFELLLPRADVCYDDSVTITLASKKANLDTSRPATDVTTSQALKQYQRYHATVQLAALFTSNQQHTFALRPGPNSTSLITDQGPDKTGPEYYAALMVYGAPHYLRQVFGGQSYDGRELTNENGPLDRTSFVLGAGLSKPADRVAAGLSYEVIRGISILGMYERARISLLNGVNVGDAFTGTKDLIPQKSSWRGKIVWGIGIDARYAMAVFTGK